jgi:hypothetical protein
MDRQPVQSSNIASIGYDGVEQTLEVEFRKTGSVYQYTDVPQRVHQELINAPSIGKYFHSRIKKEYPFFQVQ